MLVREKKERDKSIEVTSGKKRRTRSEGLDKNRISVIRSNTVLLFFDDSRVTELLCLCIEGNVTSDNVRPDHREDVVKGRSPLGPRSDVGRIVTVQPQLTKHKLVDRNPLSVVRLQCELKLTIWSSLWSRGDVR